MNDIRRDDRGSDELRIAREIVERHRADFPDFITDFNVQLDSSNGEPILFVLYKAIGEDVGRRAAEWKTRADEFSKVDIAVLWELIAALDERFPASRMIPASNWNTLQD